MTTSLKSSSVNTHLGNIVIDSDVIAQYAGSVACECFGIVGMAGISMKDGLVKLLKKENLTRGITVKIHQDKIVLEFHVIAAYGVNIKTISENLMESVKYKVEEFTGLEIESIQVYVDGVRQID